MSEPPTRSDWGREEALAQLTRRYFTSHGPARAQDFAWWSGLTVADAKRGIEMMKSHLQHEVVDGKTYWYAPLRALAKVKDPTIHLLPNYDEYLVAYRDHSASFDVSLHTGSAALYDMLARHIVVLNGRVIGGWRRTINKNEMNRDEAPRPAHRRAGRSPARRGRAVRQVPGDGGYAGWQVVSWSVVSWSVVSF